jgi:lipopolysaccharide transport system permease protein
MTTALRQITTHRDLLLAWTTRIIRARYQQSFLGGLWAVLQPAAQVLIFTVIFTQFVPINTGDTAYILFSSVAMVPWNFFAQSLSDMVTSLTQNMNLVTKVYFPREILPLSSLMARFVDFTIASVMLVLLMIIFRQPLFLPGLLFIPIIVLVQMALAFGLGLIGAAVNVFSRDVQHVITLGIQLWMFASPVVYPVERVMESGLPDVLKTLYYLNPMAGIIVSYRQVLLYEQLPGLPLLISAGIAAAILTIGYIMFKRVEFRFADVV